MQIIYKPKRDTAYNLIKGVDIAHAILLPDGYPGNRKWPWMLSVHGIGERSGGTEESLRNLVIGVDYNKDGKVDSVYVTPGMREAVDKYGLVIVVPTYESNTFFDAGKTHLLYTSVIQSFSLTPKYWYDGFSYGGGAALDAITNALTAPNIALCTPSAPTRSLGNISLIGQYNIPVHIFVNDEDTNGPTNLGVTKGIISDINKTNPAIPAQFTAFDKVGHGGHEEATAITPPKAPGGQGITDASESLYQLFFDIMVNGPRKIKTGTAAPTPIPEPLPTPIIKAVAEYKIDGYKIQLIGDKSIGFKSGMDGRWEILSAPAGVTKTQVFPGGSTYINADGILPQPGTYKFQFYLKGVEKPIDVSVDYGTGIKTLSSFTSATDLVTFSDGTTEKAEANYSQGKWSLKTASGKTLI